MVGGLNKIIEYTIHHSMMVGVAQMGILPKNQKGITTAHSRPNNNHTSLVERTHFTFCTLQILPNDTEEIHVKELYSYPSRTE